jgi:excisionase family DNA binding protein
MSTAPFLTIDQVAERLQVDRRTVRKAICLGQLEAALIFRHWRISEEALAAYIEGCTPVIQLRNRRRSA